jgi:hypothetical protein
MTDKVPPRPPKCQLRVQAVLALFRGEAVVQVSTQYRICRSELYKFQRRALEAMRDALNDAKRGPRTPHHRLAADQEAAIKHMCVSGTPRSARTRCGTGCMRVRSRLAPSSACEIGSSSPDSRSVTRLHSGHTGSRTMSDRSFAKRRTSSRCDNRTRCAEGTRGCAPWCNG